MQTDRTTKALVGIIVFLSLGSLQACMALQEECAIYSLEACRVQAEAGDTNAQFNPGFWYHIGEIVPEDGGEGVHWYRMAAEQGGMPLRRSI